MNPFQLDTFTQNWVDGVPEDELRIFYPDGFRYAAKLTPHMAALVFQNTLVSDVVSGGYHAVYQVDRLHLQIEPSKQEAFAKDYAAFFAKEAEELSKKAIHEIAALISPDNEYLPEVLEDMARNHFANVHKAFVDINTAIVDGSIGRYVPQEYVRHSGFAVYLILFMGKQDDGAICHGGVRLDGYLADKKDTWFFTEPM